MPPIRAEWREQGAQAATRPITNIMEDFEWITDPDRVAAIADDWDRLAMAERTPFLTSHWLRAWWTAYAARRRALIAAVWRNGALVGGVPLVTGWRRWGSAVNDDTPQFGLLAADAEARRSLAEQVIARSGCWTVPRLVSDEPSLASILDAAHRQRRWTRLESQGTSLVVNTGGSVDEYREQMSAKTRSELGRLQRKARREHVLELAPLARPADLEAQLTRALRLEASGWKGRAGTAILCSSATHRFVRALARDFHALGRFRISELSLDGQLAAMALSIVHGGRVFTLKVAYDEHHRRLGPGLILLMAMIERCFELGLDGYEFCGSPYSYERRFANDERSFYRVRIYRRDPINAGRYIYRRHLRPPLRVAYRQLRPASPDPIT